MTDKKREYMKHYYRSWRRENREHLRKYSRARMARLQEEANPEELAYLTKFRESKGMRKKDFAEALGVRDSTVSNWESGRLRINHGKIQAVFPDYEGGAG